MKKVYCDECKWIKISSSGMLACCFVSCTHPDNFLDDWYSKEAKRKKPDVVTHYLKDGWIRVRLEIRLKNEKINNEWREK